MESIETVVYAGQDDQATVDLTSMEREFIRKYEQLPLLWKKDHPDYCNKFKRTVGYNLLLPILRSFVPTANIFNVRQKINILRSTYRKELRKYLASKTITENGEIVFTHIPPSWKFTAMKFLFEKDCLSLSDMTQSEIVIEETVEDDSFNDLEEQELVYIQEPDTESGNDEQDIEQNPALPVYAEKKERKPIIIKNPRKRINFNDAVIIDRECSAVGSNVTCKLQRMNIEQRYYAEQLINKVLMKGLKKTLSEDTDFTDEAFMHTTTKLESLS